VNVSYTKADYPLQPSSFLNAFQLSEEEYNIFTDHFYSFFAKITCRKDIAALRSQYRDEIKTKIEWANIDHVPDKHLSS
jgi:hypothetical protein